MRFLFFILIALALNVRGAVKLPAVIGSNMVIQRGKPIVVWGWADAGEKVSVTFNGETKNATAADNGSWRVTLSPIGKGRRLTMTIKGTNTITLNNIVVGDVWLAAGQSNMEWPFCRSTNSKTATRQVRNTDIRLFAVKVTPYPTPQRNCEGHWVVCSKKTAQWFSAVALYFAFRINRDQRIPVGLIGCYKGGTPAKGWTSIEMNRTSKSGREWLTNWEQLRRTYDPKLEKLKHDKAMNEWRSKPKNQRSQWPPQVFNPFTDITQPSGLYNGLIHPLIPYALKGFLWYQGEHDSNRVEDAIGYRIDLANLIEDWRARWRDEKLPFLFVQLPNFETAAHWQITRDSMLHVYRTTPHTGMAVIIDAGTPHSPHPHNKKIVGNRLADIALHDVYGRLNTNHMGPIYKSMEVRSGKIRLTFKFLGGGFVTSDSKPLRHFTIAGEDHRFVPATAVIDGIEVVVSTKAVPNPVAVRYAWSNNPEKINFYNRAGFPASPFRTDTWSLTE